MWKTLILPFLPDDASKFEVYEVCGLNTEYLLLQLFGSFGNAKILATLIDGHAVFKDSDHLRVLPKDRFLSDFSLIKLSVSKRNRLDKLNVVLFFNKLVV